jgi:hypothetical protein
MHLAVIVSYKGLKARCPLAIGHTAQSPSSLLIVPATRVSCLLAVLITRVSIGMFKIVRGGLGQFAS